VAAPASDVTFIVRLTRSPGFFCRQIDCSVRTNRNELVTVRQRRVGDLFDASKYSLDIEMTVRYERRGTSVGFEFVAIRVQTGPAGPAT
jgi:hypothetical protein